MLSWWTYRQLFSGLEEKRETKGNYKTKGKKAQCRFESIVFGKKQCYIRKIDI